MARNVLAAWLVCLAPALAVAGLDAIGGKAPPAAGPEARPPAHWSLRPRGADDIDATDKEREPHRALAPEVDNSSYASEAADATN